MEANNNTALRDALEQVKNAHHTDDESEWFDIESGDGTGRPLICIVEDALESPPRQCDVGTAKEQMERWEKFCQEHHEYWKPGKSLTAVQRCNCPCYEGNGCNYFIWSQMPYEENNGRK